MKKKMMSSAISLGLGTIALALAAMPSYALTAPALKLADTGGNVVTIDSTGTVTFSAGCACTTTSSVVASGSVTWTGTIGPFTVFSANGRTKPAIGEPSIDIGVGSVWTAGLGGTLTISWTDVGFSGSTPAFMNASTTFQAGSGSVLYTAYVDDGNVPFGTGITVGTIGPVTTSDSTGILGIGPIVEPFSMTNVEAITLAPNSTFVNDFSDQAAPYPPLRLTCPVASGQIGVPYNSGIGILGGVSPYTFSITAGSLPAGLILNVDGTITGTPLSSGAFSFTAQVVDSSGFVGSDTVTSSCGITIASPPPTLACPSITSGMVGSGYNSSLVAMGGTSPYTFSIQLGSLPGGLFLDANRGAITGTPSASGTFTFTASVLDSSKPTGNTSTASCTITIAPPPPPMTLTCAATAGTVGTVYSSTLSASGGTAPYRFALAPGSGILPGGLMLADSGAITGTPTGAGTFPYVLQVTDSSGNTVSGTATKSCSISIVNAQTAPLTLSCPANTATVGVAYNSAEVAAGGVPAYTYSVSVGTLPAGLTLNAATGAITGTPTAAGTSNFTAKAVDSSGNSATNNITKSCSVVAAAGSAVKAGDAATIGFWHNGNGQSVITSLNGGSTSKTLANWLATQFPYLYGSHSANNLTNKTNADVAALFMTFFGVKGTKTSAQILSAALASCVTSTTLGGTDATITANRTKYGFNFSSGGTALKTYNVGTSGSSIGLVNNQSYTVLQLLNQANLTTQGGTFNANAFNTIFNGINTVGDIV